MVSQLVKLSNVIVLIMLKATRNVSVSQKIIITNSVHPDTVTDYKKYK